MNFRDSILAGALVVALAGCAKKTTEEHIASAQDFLQQGKKESAILELKNAISSAPQNAELRELLGDIYLSQGEVDGAEKELQRALQMAPEKLPEFTPRLVEIYLSNNDYEGLKSLLQDSELTNCQECQLSELWLSLVNNESTDIDSVLATYPQNEQWKVSAIELFTKSNFSQAKQLLKENKPALLESKTSEKLILAQVAMRTGAPETALELYNGMLQEKPKMFWLHIPLAQIQFALKDFGAAENHTRQVLKINSKHGFGNYMLGLLQAKNGQHQEANDSAEAALTSGYDTTGSRLLLGVTQYKLERYEQSLSNLRVATQDLPEKHFAHQLLISTQLKLGYTDEAVQQLVGREDHSAMDMPLLGMSASMLGDSEGEQALKELLKGKVNDEAFDAPGFANQKSLINLVLGDETGVEELDQVLTDDAGKDTLSLAKVLANLKQGNIDEALAALQEWKLHNPKNVEPYNFEGSILYAQGEIDKAHDVYQKALEVSPNNAPSMFFDIRYTMSKEGFDSAINKAKMLLDAHPLHLAGLRVLVVLSMNSGKDLGEAIDYATKATKAEGSNIQHRLMLASTYASSGAFPLTIKVLSELDASEAQKFNQYWELKHLVAVNANSETAVTENFEKWKRNIPATARSYLQYAGFLLSVSNRSRAVQIVSSATEAFPQNDAIKAYLVYVLIEAGNNARAKSVVEELEAKPLLKSVSSFLAGYYYASNEQDKLALEKFREHYALTQTNRSALLIAQLMKKLNQDASGFLEQHLIEKPDDLINRNLLAESYISKAPAKARSHYQQYFEAGGQSGIALNNYAWLLGQSKEFAQAKEYIQRAVAAQGEEWAFWETYAEILLGNAEYQEIENILTDKFNKMPSLSIFYAEALIKLNKKDKAKEILANSELTVPANLKAKWDELLSATS